jgi:hypothetical protein
MSAMVGAFCRGSGVAGEVQGLARWGAVGGAGAAGRARRQGLVVAPAVAVAGGGCRYIRYMGYIAGQPCSGGDSLIRYIRYITGACSGCSGRGLRVRYMPVAGVSCGIGRL